MLVVCDGMGGANAGDLASELAIDSLVSEFNEKNETPTLVEFKETVERANERIFQVGKSDSSQRGLGTTLSGIILDKTGFKIIHVGDSRIYRLRNNRITQLTSDHTWVSELSSSGAIGEENISMSPMSHMLSRSLGVGKDVNLDSFESDDLEVGDLFLLCSDGLHNYFKNDDLQDFLISNERFKTLDRAGSDLLEFSLNAGGADNISVLLVKPLQSKAAIGKCSIIKVVNVERKLRKNFFDNSEAETSADDSFNSFFNEYQGDHGNHSVSNSFAQNGVVLDSLKYFLFGSLFALFVAGFVWFVRKPEAVSLSEAGSLSSSDAIRVKNALQLGVSKEADFSVFENDFFVSLDDLYAFIRLKNKEILYISESPPIHFRQDKEGDSDSGPIIWEAERKRVSAVKASINFVKNKESEDLSKILKLERGNSFLKGGNLELVGLKDKIDLREKIGDIDEKIIQLGIQSKEEAGKYEIELNDVVRQIDVELLRIQKISEEGKSNALRLAELDKLMKIGSDEAIDMLAARLDSFDVSFEPALRRVKLLRNTQEYYLDLMGKIQKLDEIFAKLSSVQRELIGAQKDLYSDLERALDRAKSENAAYVAGINWTRYLLNLERTRVQKALGFLGGYTPASKESRTELLNTLSANRIKFLKEYRQLEQVVPDQLEFNKSLSEDFERIKLSLSNGKL